MSGFKHRLEDRLEQRVRREFGQQAYHRELDALCRQIDEDDKSISQSRAEIEKIKHFLIEAG